MSNLDTTQVADSLRAVDLVVGGGSGMGAAVAREIRSDRLLLIADRSVEAAEAIAAPLGDGALALACDIADAGSVARLAERTGPIRSLVVTAGLSPTMASGQRILEVNLVGMARLVDALEPSIGEGSVAVLFASCAAHGEPLPAEVEQILDDPLSDDLIDNLRAIGLDPENPGTAYALSKVGVIRLARRKSVTWWPRGARIVSLSPGIIDTPMGAREFEQQPVMASMVDAVGRMGTSEEIARVVHFLLSPDASFISGTDLLVDGGVTAMLRSSV
jgi:NAD(P)-dependent dehydrogenase (short-subunit alcohol dehydrogenase family)